MPAISATLVLTPRNPHRCAGCGGWIEGLHVRAFGYARKGDTPVTIRVCVDCASRSKDEKICQAEGAEPSHEMMDRVARLRQEKPATSEPDG